MDDAMREELGWVEHDGHVRVSLDAPEDWLWEIVEIPRRVALIDIVAPTEDAQRRVYRFARLDVILGVLLAAGSALSAASVNAVTSYRPGLGFFAVWVVVVGLMRLAYAAARPRPSDVVVELQHGTLTIVHGDRRQADPLHEATLSTREGELIVEVDGSQRTFPVATGSDALAWFCEYVEDRKAARGTPGDVPTQLRAIESAANPII